MKYIVKFFIISYFLLIYHSFVFADFIICDSGNINYNGTSITEICNGGYQDSSIPLTESYTGSFIEYDLDYFGNNYIGNIKNIDLDNNLPVGFFDEFRYTNVLNTKPDYELSAGYLGQSNINIKNIDLDNNLPVGFFDGFRYTNVLNTKPDYELSAGYLGQSNINIKNIDLDNNLPVGFFDEIRVTKILNDKFLYLVPVGFFGKLLPIVDTGSKEILTETGNLLPIADTGSTEILTETGNLLPIVDTGSKEILTETVNLLSIADTGSTEILTETGKILPIINIGSITKPSNILSAGSSGGIIMTNKEFYKYLFKKYSYSDYSKNGYLIYDYDIFINNMANFLLLNSYKNGSSLINNIEQKRIELYVQNSKLGDVFSLLMKKMKQINIVFQKGENNHKIFYLLDYILKK